MNKEIHLFIHLRELPVYSRHPGDARVRSRVRPGSAVGGQIGQNRTTRRVVGILGFSPGDCLVGPPLFGICASFPSGVCFFFYKRALGVEQIFYKKL